MKIVGMLRIKNEARWIERCIGSILPICSEIFILDDHSTDGTPEICKAIPKVALFESPFEGLNEVRDKNYLLERVESSQPDWIVAIDGDEMLAPQSVEKLSSMVSDCRTPSISPRILYLWNSEDQVRMDGVYHDFHRESIFRPNGARFIETRNGANFHCGNVPLEQRQRRQVVNDVVLLHFGYMRREDRLRKWEFYNANDPKNRCEGYDSRYPNRRTYPHMVQGDVPEVPADVRLMHAGPLKIRPLAEVLAD